MGNSKIDPRTLRITDIRFIDIDGAPKRCTILKIMTNYGIVGYGEVRDASSKTYALMLKSRLLGEIRTMWTAFFTKSNSSAVRLDKGGVPLY